MARESTEWESTRQLWGPWADEPIERSRAVRRQLSDDAFEAPEAKRPRPIEEGLTPTKAKAPLGRTLADGPPGLSIGGKKRGRPRGSTKKKKAMRLEDDRDEDYEMDDTGREEQRKKRVADVTDMATAEKVPRRSE